MPYKHNESCRHKIKKPHYKVTNWAEYNNALRKRTDMTLWFTEEDIANWRSAKTGVVVASSSTPIMGYKLRCSFVKSPGVKRSVL